MNTSATPLVSATSKKGIQLTPILSAAGMEFDLPPFNTFGIFQTQSTEPDRKPWNSVCPLLEERHRAAPRDCRKNICEDTLWHLGRKNRKITPCTSLGRRGRGRWVVRLLSGVWIAVGIFDVVDVEGAVHGDKSHHRHRRWPIAQPDSRRPALREII